MKKIINKFPERVNKIFAVYLIGEKNKISKQQFRRKIKWRE